MLGTPIIAKNNADGEDEETDYRDQIIADIAERECKRVSRKVIHALRRMTEGMQSGDDTPLKTIWDEVCVQVQSQESIMWDADLDTITRIIWDEIERLNAPTKQAIWLQTNEGMDWQAENEDQKTATFCEGDIIDYILHDQVLSVAADPTNKRIEKYIESSIEFD